MKIGLLALSGVRARTERIAKLGVTLPGFVHRGEIIASLPSLALLIIAALTPEDVEVEYIEVPDINQHEINPDFDWSPCPPTRLRFSRPMSLPTGIGHEV